MGVEVLTVVATVGVVSEPNEQTDRSLHSDCKLD